MDILNWLYLAKNKFVRTTLSSTKDLMIFGAKVGFSKRGDKYQNYAMSAEDFLAINRPYKVYTALLTQSGGDNEQALDAGFTVVKGVTYTIATNDYNVDLSRYGAPNNNVGTQFVAIITDTLDGLLDYMTLSYNTGAPVVTVLENTIGNVWFTYLAGGVYGVVSNNLFIQNKSSIALGNVTWDGGSGILKSGFDGDSDGYVVTALINGDPVTNGSLLNTMLEIRVYN